VNAKLCRVKITNKDFAKVRIILEQSAPTYEARGLEWEHVYLQAKVQTEGG